jgi:7-dehydrocholesterol reductase
MAISNDTTIGISSSSTTTSKNGHHNDLDHVTTTNTTSLTSSSTPSGRTGGTSNMTSINDPKDNWNISVGGVLPYRDTLGPIMLMMLTPCFSIIFFHVCANMNGDFYTFFKELVFGFGGTNYKNVISTLYSIWPNPLDEETWTFLLSFMIYELLIMKIVPGNEFVATMTSTGHRPIYKANGLACYFITLFTVIIMQVCNVYNFARVYDKFGNILSSLNVFAWVFCLMLLIKGHFVPSSTDHGTTGNIIIDFYWGMELYPRIFGWDVKQFTNCRFGLMFWAVALLCFGFKNIELNHGTLQIGLAISIGLQLIYLTKFYYWEMGYMCSMDIQHDRAGYYICWGCLVWVPGIYTSAAFYLTTSCPQLSHISAFIISFLGFICIVINYDSDNQRYVFRQTNGQCTIWGSAYPPPRYIEAKYRTTADDNQLKTSLLLVDGYWKISRHFHYVPEILASFFWSVSALDTGLIGPYFYVIYLTILLLDRAYRDDDRCRKKYGKYWLEYCRDVPYKVIPGIV